ncbi:MAG: DUF1638 domain-containing protein [Spirochaetes bacterium]|nr:DUF1638 domain-containing protein [Spirochaetota bacterium]
MDSRDNGMKKKPYVIACSVLALDLKHSAEKEGLDLNYEFLEAGLHNNPELLREKVQAAVDKASCSELYDRIIIGYGICGKGTVGIQAGNVPLVIPKVHDCISLFLGGDREYKAQFKKYPGTIYLSAGWCEGTMESDPQGEQYAYFGDQKLKFDDLAEKYGKNTAKLTFNFLNTWQKNYQRAAFIETDSKSSAKYEAMAKNMAEAFNWKYEKIKGSHSLINKLITAKETTKEILFVPPHNVIGFDPAQESLSVNPVVKQTSAEDQSVSYVKIEFDDDSNQDYIKIGLGVDAGGTYTDAVIYDLESNVTICKAKSLTTKWDFTIGISKAMEQLDQNLLNKIELISLSTTLATNAIVENEGQKVGLLLMPPYGMDIMQDIPHQPKSIIQGQMEITGKEILPVNPDEIKSTVYQMMENHLVTAFAVSGFASFVNPEHELHVKKVIQEETGLFVSCGHELSDNLNYQTRAVTAMLNAKIIPRLANLLLDLEKVMNRYGIKSPVVVVKGDGTLMSSEMAKKRPVETILSGPAASVAGARHLTGIDDALVVDVGGTTTDTAALTAGLVRLNVHGSTVGGHRTHVKALDIRTTGLGGDSLILYESGKFVIGPKRVAPVSWLGEIMPGIETAMEYISRHMRHHAGSTREMQLLAKTGEIKSIQLTPLEKEVLTLLELRPYSIHEMVQTTGVLCEGSLPLERLEENFIIQKCGLTLTDMLHISGRFLKWNTKTAEQYAEFYSYLARMPLQELSEYLLELGIKQLSRELLKHRLNDDTDSDMLDNCSVCRTLVDHLLNEQHPNYEVAINFTHPVIGIGAPVSFFLPEAVLPFRTKAVLPEDADVANAIGAITSHVYIQKQLWIVPDEDGGFTVEGISGTRHFEELDEADKFARQILMEMVQEQAAEAGTSCRTIDFEIKDSMPTTPKGETVFLERRISASLKGRPDLVIRKSSNK